MLDVAIFFFLLSILAAVFGFGGIAGAATGLAQMLFLIFLITSAFVLLFGADNHNNSHTAS